MWTEVRSHRRVSSRRRRRMSIGDWCTRRRLRRVVPGNHAGYELSTMNIGSRPASRQLGSSRTCGIPWVFSWSQCRLICRAGSVSECRPWTWVGDDDDRLAELREMHERCPGRTVVSNMVQVLAKTDLVIAGTLPDARRRCPSAPRSCSTSLPPSTPGWCGLAKVVGSRRPSYDNPSWPAACAIAFPTSRR